MKFFLKLCLSVLVCASTQSQACSYAVNEVGIKNQLAAHFLTTLNIGIDEVLTQVQKLEISNFSYFESKPTMMCPEEMTYSMNINIKYMGSGYCMASALVTLVEGWGADSYRYFKVDYPVGSPSCLYLEFSDMK